MDNTQKNDSFWDSYSKMSRNERNDWNKQYEDRELSNKKKKLEKTHFSLGSVQEDMGVLQSKISELISENDVYGFNVDNVIATIKIHMRDSVASDSDAYYKLQEMIDDLEVLSKVLSQSDSKMATIYQKLEEFSDPASQIWSDGEENMDDVENPELNESIEKIKSNFKRFL